MNDRRTFLKWSGLAAASLSAPVWLTGCGERIPPATGPREVRRARVIWYSQTGNTARIGRLIATVWEKHGIEVDASEIREIDPADCAGYDLLAAGSPVNHYDAPEFVKNWLDRLPPLDHTPTAAFVTHGLPPSNQHNTGCAILEHLRARGGIPLGLAAFGNLGTYPPAWAFFPEKALEARNHPNRETFQQAARYAESILERARNGRAVGIRRELSFGDVKKNLAPIWFSKLITDEHYIDREKCLGCGRCREKCPTGAIDPEHFTVDKRLCVDCMGCLNNCPAGAVVMVYWGKKLTGYHDFLKENKIVIPEPEDLGIV